MKTKPTVKMNHPDIPPLGNHSNHTRRMKAKMLSLLLLVGSLSLLPYRAVHAQSIPSDKQAIAMLTEFYTAYIIEWAKPPTRDNLIKQKALPTKYCTASLLRTLKAQDQQGYIEADPFLHAQDVHISFLETLFVRRDLRNANAYTVSFGDAASHFKAVIHLTVTKQGDRFKIATIR